MRVLIATWVVCLFVACTTVALGLDDRAEIRAAYGRWDGLVNQNNIDGLSVLLTPTFVTLENDGKSYNARQTISRAKAFYANKRKVQMKTTIDELTKSGDEAYVKVTCRVSYLAKEKGSWKKSGLVMHGIDTLKKTPQGWKWAMIWDVP